MFEFFDAPRAMDFKNPVVWHWLLALQNGEDLKFRPEWQAHFNEYAPVVEAVASSMRYAATLLQHYWLEHSNKMECSKLMGPDFVFDAL